MTVVNSRIDQIPTKADFLAALLQLICVPAILSISSGLLKWCVILLARNLISCTFLIMVLKQLGSWSGMVAVKGG